MTNTKDRAKNDCGLTAIRSGAPLALRGIEVTARVAELMAQTVLARKFRNDADENLERGYTFPLPLSAGNAQSVPTC